MFTLTKRVLPHHTDYAGVMWHGAYTKWLELSRCEYLEQLGDSLGALGEGYVYPVIEQRFQFKKPARLNDQLEIKTEFELKLPRLSFKQRVYKVKEQQLIMEADTTCLVTDQTLKPLRRLPEDYIAKFKP